MGLNLDVDCKDATTHKMRKSLRWLEIQRHETSGFPPTWAWLSLPALKLLSRTPSVMAEPLGTRLAPFSTNKTKKVLKHY
jgi:hypothetical protein